MKKDLRFRANAGVKHIGYNMTIQYIIFVNQRRTSDAVLDSVILTCHFGSNYKPNNMNRFFRPSLNVLRRRHFVSISGVSTFESDLGLVPFSPMEIP